MSFFRLLEAERDQKALSRSLCQLLSCHSRSLSPALGQKRVHAWIMRPLQRFREPPDLHLSVLGQGVVSCCSLNSIDGDHDAAANASV